MFIILRQTEHAENLPIIPYLFRLLLLNIIFNESHTIPIRSLKNIHGHRAHFLPLYCYMRGNIHNGLNKRIE